MSLVYILYIIEGGKYLKMLILSFLGTVCPTDWELTQLVARTLHRWDQYNSIIVFVNFTIFFRTMLVFVLLLTGVSMESAAPRPQPPQPQHQPPLHPQQPHLPPLRRRHRPPRHQLQRQQPWLASLQASRAGMPPAVQLEVPSAAGVQLAQCSLVPAVTVLNS